MGQLRGLLKYRLSIAVLVTFIFLASGVHAQPPVLKTSVALEDIGALTQDFLAVPEVRQMIGTEQKLIEYSLGQGCIARQHSQAWVRVAGGRVFEVSATPAAPSVRGQPDFTISMPCSAGLSVLNSADKTRTVLSMLSKNVITVNARDLRKQALIRASMASLTIQGSGFRPSERIAIVTIIPDNNMVVNQHGAPVGAVCNNHDRFASPPPQARVTFTGPPGVLAQHPDVIKKADPVWQHEMNNDHTIGKTPGAEVAPNWRSDPGAYGLPGGMGLDVVQPDSKFWRYYVFSNIERLQTARMVELDQRNREFVSWWQSRSWRAEERRLNDAYTLYLSNFKEGEAVGAVNALGFLIGYDLSNSASSELQKQGLVKPIPDLREEDYNYSPDAIIL